MASQRALRFSFSLRALTALFVVLGAVSATIAWKKARVQKQRATADRINALGGKVFHANVVERREPKAPQWLLTRLGIDTFEGLAQIELENTGVEDISFLANLSAVQHLYLDRTGVSDLSPLAAMDSLVLLSLDHTPVVDLSPIENLASLEILSISDSAVDSLRPLHSLTHLKKLYARRVPAAESEFDALRQALPTCEIEH